jgi:hypothetical protein
MLGEVKEVHVWTNRPVWQGQGKMRPDGEDTIPESLDWNVWLGTAKDRPFKAGAYHKFHWRGAFDFGTGAFGDMACHTMNLPYRSLKLGALDAVECLQIDGRNTDSYPAKSIVKMTYAARTGMPAVDLFWYDGNLKPSEEIMPQVIGTFGKMPNTGCLIVGDKGMVVSENDYGEVAYLGLKGEAKMKSMQGNAFADIPQKYPRLGWHHKEFINACKGEGKAFSDIDHSVPMVESILLGCIAQQVPGKLTWDACKKTFDNAEANALLKPHIRTGWEY